MGTRIHFDHGLTCFDKQPLGTGPSAPGSYAGNASTAIIGNDPAICEILELAQQVADTDATVLITGECGTGKELIATFLHRNSSRSKAPFLAVNCGAIPESLQESELFGHVKGAFTGAISHKVGKFEAANGGTVFLDEVSEMSPGFQVNMLRILQSGEYAPVGMAENRYCDIRVVAATNCDLRSLTDAGGFRRDLFYRLNIINLVLPPLRQRKEDIPLLADHFLRRYDAAYVKPGIRLSRNAMKCLLQYDYPGNVRELENMIQRAVILCGDNLITEQYLPAELRSDCPQKNESQPTQFHEAKGKAIEEFERAYLSTALRTCGGIVSRAAQSSGLSERNFHEKLKKYGIHGKSYRA